MKRIEISRLKDGRYNIKFYTGQGLTKVPTGAATADSWDELVTIVGNSNYLEIPK